MKLINLKNNELLIDKNTNKPIIIIHDLKEENENSLKITVKEGIKASILEVFNDSTSKLNYNRKLIIEKNATLEYVKFQNVQEKSILDFNYILQLDENSKLNIINLELGFGSNNNKYETNLDKTNSELNIHGLVKIFDNTDSKSIFNITHNAPNTYSNISYKQVLEDKTKATFEAKSIVNEKASFSKVIQNSDTLLLSDEAVIFARPHLEINIDELEANHGATTGTLDEEQLLYLQSRGISKNKALKILLKAFENEIYDKIKDYEIKEFIENQERIKDV